MPQGKSDNLLATVTTVLKEKLALESKEQGLVRSLNKVLKKMGYQVTKLEKPARGKRRKRKAVKGQRRPGRPAGSGRNRRGRPPKKQ